MSIRLRLCNYDLTDVLLETSAAGFKADMISNITWLFIWLTLLWVNAAAHTNIYCAHLHLFTITTSRTNPHKVDMNRGQTAERLITVCMETRASLYVQRNIFTLTQPENRRIFVDSLKHTNTLYLHICRKCTSVIPSLLVLLDNSKASTDPLLAGLVSAFVVVAAIMSVLLFLKFRNTNDGPEFRRLQDLPMVRLRSTIHLKTHTC